MKTLYDIIQSNNVEPVDSNIDGHIHLFDHNGFINKSLVDLSKKCVCFADIAFRYLEQYKNGEIINYYDNFIKRHYNPSKHILLATGITADEIIDIYKKYPQFIKGFGELKCYSEDIGGKLPFGNLKWIKPLLEYNVNICLPVYIHYNLDDDTKVSDFENLLKMYNFPIVLCHCGMHDDCDYVGIHYKILKLMNTYNNLYVDISHDAIDFYIKNINKLLELNNSRVIIGTDINPAIGRVIDNPLQTANTIYDKFNTLNKLGDFNNTTKKLFGYDNFK